MSYRAADYTGRMASTEAKALGLVFMHTAAPLMRACIVAGVHYLDIAAELDSYRLAENLMERQGQPG